MAPSFVEVLSDTMQIASSVVAKYSALKVKLQICASVSGSKKVETPKDVNQKHLESMSIFLEFAYS